MTGILLAGLLLGAPAQAQPQPGQLVAAPFRDFSGGLNDAADASNLEVTESPGSLNIVIDDPTGSIKPRNGYVECGRLPSGNNTTAMYEFVRSNGTRRLIVTDNENYYQTADCIAFTRFMLGQSATALPTFRTIRDELWTVNRATHAWVWTGSTTTLLDTRVGTPNPAPPRAAYIDYWKERVWMARTIAQPSSLQFSALTDSAGNDIAPSTGSLSWPAANVIYVDRDGGCPIYGIKTHRDNLYVFKGECGIFRIVFNNEFDISVEKTLASVGSLFHYSIVERDNFLEFVGPDGTYAFDGENAVRTSDKIPSRFSTIQQPSAGEASSVWTTQNDFGAGTSTAAITTAVSAGDVQLSTNSAIIPNGNFETGSLSNWTCVAVSSAGTANSTVSCNVLSSGSPNHAGVSQPAQGTYSGWALLDRTGVNCGAPFVQAYVIGVDGSTKTVKDQSSGVTIASTQTIDTSAYAGETVFMKMAADCDSRATYLYSSTFVAKGDITYLASAGTFGTSPVYVGFSVIDKIENTEYFAQGLYTSEIRSIVSVSSYSTFEVTQDLNGGSIAYEIRVGTNATGILSASYSSIIPGSVVNASTQHLSFQWRGTLVAPSNKKETPQINEVSINYLTGDISENSIFGINWNNRYCFSAASGTASTNNIVLCRAKAPTNTWTLYDWQVGPMVKFNNNFYAASSTGPAINRMDYGSNDGGAAINWYWTSRDESWGDYTRYKRLLELQIDFRKDSATSVKFGYSSDHGESWTDRTINMNGTGRATSRQFVNAGRNMDFRIRVANSVIDERATILGIIGWAIPEARRQ